MLDNQITLDHNIPNLPGPPNPPSDLGYNDRVVIESSVDLQWTRPSYTGGVDVMKYTVSANGRRLEVMDDSDSVSYTTSGLVYGEVQVSAINTCGQESQPATINITARGELYYNFSPERFHYNTLRSFNRACAHSA